MFLLLPLYMECSPLHLKSHATVPLTCCTVGVARMPRLSPRRLFLYLACGVNGSSSHHSHPTGPLTCCTVGVARMPRLSP
jgi:hypothetical protein